ncbi:hypothetical protein MYX07_00835 [Patescibacteria group bacterium AH-259-L07]|nr:hypothetical protein [Patescibacteria group bacterium AH-259-L07]
MLGKIIGWLIFGVVAGVTFTALFISIAADAGLAVAIGICGTSALYIGSACLGAYAISHDPFFS